VKTKATSHMENRNKKNMMDEQQQYEKEKGCKISESATRTLGTSKKN
jgi:hypothetical protein